MTWIIFGSGIIIGFSFGWLSGFCRGFEEGVGLLVREREYEPKSQADVLCGLLDRAAKK